MLAATVLALGSAVIHASWNLLIKTSGDRALAAWGQFLAGAVLVAPVVVVTGGPGWVALPYLVGTGVVHVAYVEALAAAYTHGDFSLAYPLARGGGAVLAAVGGVVLLADRLPVAAWLALAVVAGGLASLRAPRGRALVLALLTAGCIAVYTVIDAAGARAASGGVPYGSASVLASGVAITAVNLARPARRARLGDLRWAWRRHLVGGLGIGVAYTMVLVAVRLAPVGYVTMLRESSVVLGALLGWLVLREPLGGRRLVASAVVLGGLVLLVAAGR